MPLTSPIAYTQAARVQDAIVRHHLDAKAKRFSCEPVVLTMEMQPVYTTGRRERGHMTAHERAVLEDNGKAIVVEALRGGQTTFHGPGQLVAYPILDLARSPSPSTCSIGMSPRCYVHMLEQSLIDTLDKYQVHAFRTENTGVWASSTQKIAAIGIHLRRGITSHGVALNVDVDLDFFDRIIACGLPGMKTTSIRDFTGTIPPLSLVTNEYVQQLASGLKCDHVETMSLQNYHNLIGIR